MSDNIRWESEGQSFGGKYLKPIDKVRVTDDLIYFETEGMLKTDMEQVHLMHVRDVDVSQTFLQKTRGVGTIRVHVTHPDGSQETAELNDMPDFRKGAEIINAAAKQARARERQADQTHYYAGGQAPTFAPPHGSPQTPAPKEDGPMERLEHLKKMRDEGILSEDEYITKRSEIISKL